MTLSEELGLVPVLLPSLICYSLKTLQDTRVSPLTGDCACPQAEGFGRWKEALSMSSKNHNRKNTSINRSDSSNTFSFLSEYGTKRNSRIWAYGADIRRETRKRCRWVGGQQSSRAVPGRRVSGKGGRRKRSRVSLALPSVSNSTHTLRGRSAAVLHCTDVCVWQQCHTPRQMPFAPTFVTLN